MVFHERLATLVGQEVVIWARQFTLLGALQKAGLEFAVLSNPETFRGEYSRLAGASPSPLSSSRLLIRTEAIDSVFFPIQVQVMDVPHAFLGQIANLQVPWKSSESGEWASTGVILEVGRDHLLLSTPRPMPMWTLSSATGTC